MVVGLGFLRGPPKRYYIGGSRWFFGDFQDFREFRVRDSTGRGRAWGLQEVEGSNIALLWSIRDDRGDGATGSVKECIPEIISR